jgi:apolipoprotein D and lipocalin family protein
MGNTNKKQIINEVVKNVDLEKYMGEWYEISSNPSFFEKEGTSNVKAIYSLNKENGTVNVYNECIYKGKLKTIKGIAYPSSKTNSTFIVNFGFFDGDYWIIRLDKNYEWAVVSEPYGEYLWILYRMPFIDFDLYESILDSIKDTVDISKLKITEQNR